jgi:hypothetical protein
MQVFIDEPGAFLHETDLPTIPNVGDFVSYQNSPPSVETRRVVWRRIEASTTAGISRIVIGVADGKRQTRAGDLA